MILLLKAHALDRIGRTEPFIELAPIDQVLQLDLSKGAALAGLDVGGLNRDPQAAVMGDDVTGFDGVAVDLHDGSRVSTGWDSPPAHRRTQDRAMGAEPSPQAR